MEKNKAEIELIESYLLEQIPISSAMGVKIDFASLEKVVLKAPLSNNINHKNTVFGGSLHAVATLACWVLLHLNLTKLTDISLQIVIASSEVSYLTAIDSDFKAECSLPDSAEWDKFIKTLQKKGKGRIKLKAVIFQNQTLAVDYTGVFAAIKTG